MCGGVSVREGCGGVGVGVRERGVCEGETGVCSCVCVSSSPTYRYRHCFDISHNCLLLAQSWRSAQYKTVDPHWD